MFDHNTEAAVRIAEKVRECGGTAYFVGGYVRDSILGKETKDIDIEIHGVPAGKLADILDSLGGCTSMGASFGIYGLKGCEIDIALPRKEKCSGRGHKDFEVFTDPFISPKTAAIRRDFTMNALMKNVLTGEVLDFFGGLDDIGHGIIRHVNSISFAEDPLRVLRAAQFASRFGFSVADETVALCRSMDLTALSRERIFGELEKALLKSETPSVFFRQLSEMDQLSFWFPELEALENVEQDPEYHPEGNVWEHTMKTLDCAALLRSCADNPRAFMISALCHDFGKAAVTEHINGRIHAYRHETEGVPIVMAFLSRLTNETEIIRYVTNMTELHMRPTALVREGASHKSFMKMFDSAVDPSDLLLVAKADWLGSSGDPALYEETDAKLREKLDTYNSLMSRPYVQGKDLIKAGLAPGPDFKEALEYAHKLRLAGIEKELALKQTLGMIRSWHT